MIITQTMFHLYLIRLGLFMQMIDEKENCFFALLHGIETPNPLYFSRVEELPTGEFWVQLCKKDIEEREIIQNQFFQ